MAPIRLNALQNRHQADPMTCALLERAEAILAQHQGWNQTSRDLIIEQARAFQIGDQKTRRILEEIRRAACPAAAPDHPAQNAADFVAFLTSARIGYIIFAALCVCGILAQLAGRRKTSLS